MKGRALRRALASTDADRISGDVPLIVDTTELITPTIAREMLQSNRSNRPINWNKVEEYADVMSAGGWKLHAQGIIFDKNGELLNGQNRLWAVVYSDTSVLMRVSRGNPPESAKLIDRGTQQSARDLASRDTRRKHSATEAAIARAVCVMRGNTHPSRDALADVMASKSQVIEALLDEVRGTRKTRAVLMVLGVIADVAHDAAGARVLGRAASVMADRFEATLMPELADRCWGKGAAFLNALRVARTVIVGRSD